MLANLTGLSQRARQDDALANQVLAHIVNHTQQKNRDRLLETPVGLWRKVDSPTVAFTIGHTYRAVKETIYARVH